MPKHFVYLQSAQRKSAYVKVYAFVLKQFTENPENCFKQRQQLELMKCNKNEINAKNIWIS